MDVAELQLWEQWRKQRDAGARDALVLKYSPWARMLARDVYLRVYLVRDAWQDCVQNALVGMLDAMERFDPFIGAAFSTYARSRVRGAVFDGLRALSEVRVQVSRQPESDLLHERTQSLMNTDMPEGGEEGDPLEVFVSITAQLGLGFLMDTQSMPAQESASPDAYTEMERHSLLAAVSRRLELLQERERTILTLHYYHQVPFNEIARQLQLTKGRVSQLHKRALSDLRVLLKTTDSAHC